MSHPISANYHPVGKDKMRATNQFLERLRFSPGRSPGSPLAILLICLFCALFFVGLSLTMSRPAEKLLRADRYGQLPLYFMKNEGQLNPEVKYYERGLGHSIFFSEEEIVFSFEKTGDRFANLSEGESVARSTERSNSRRGEKGAEFSQVRLFPIGIHKDVRIDGQEQQDGRVNYFLGKGPAKWKTNIPTYGSIVYQEAYPGIDFRFYGSNQRLEYDVIIKPGAKPSQVKFGYQGVQNFRTTEEGDLHLELPDGGILVHKKPMAYQEINGKHVNVAGRFDIEQRSPYSSKESPDFVFGFEVASYNGNYPLIIDPVLVYSTYVGGSGSDAGYAIAVDALGGAYVTGRTSSSDFPTKPHLQSSFMGGSADVFVLKLNAAGDKLDYSTYLGGNDTQSGYAIAVDETGCAYITGVTTSPDFPTVNPYPSTPGSPDSPRAFVVKLNPKGSVVYSTYLGASQSDTGLGIAVDRDGKAYVTGETSSSDFPIVGSAFTYGGGSFDAFVAKLGISGDVLEYSTFLGGNDTDSGYGVAVDDNGSIYIAGETSSSDFPMAGGAQIEYGGGAADAFVVKIDGTSGLIGYSTYLGGSGADFGRGIAVDLNHSVYVTGKTSSASGFPLANPWQSGFGGGAFDVFVTKLDPTGYSLSYSTFLGGDGNDTGQAIAVDGSGRAYVTGQTSGNFPTIKAIQNVHGGGSADAFVARLNAMGDSLDFSTYLGGTADDIGYGIATDSKGDIYVAGKTSSVDFPWIANAFMKVNGGGSDAFVAKLNALLASFSASPTSGGYPLTVKFTDLSEGTISSWSWNFGDGNSTTAQNPSHTYVAPGSYAVSLKVGGEAGNDTETRDGYITVTKPDVTIVATKARVSKAGSEKGEFTISRSSSTSVDLTVNYTLGGSAKNGIDYQALPGSVIIPAGASSAAISLTPIDDGIYDGNQTATVDLSGGALYTVGSPNAATVTIVDNILPAVSVTASSPSVPRSGSQSAQFVFTTSKAASFPVTVNYTVGGTATSGTHFKPLTGPVIIPAGSTSATVALTPVDGLYDGNHTVVVTLASGSFYTIGSPATATITIVDNFPVSVTASTPSVPRSGSQSAQFVFTTSKAASFPVTVNYTVGGTATSGAHFKPLTGPVIIPAGSTSATVALTPVDGLYDGNHTVVVTLASGSFYTIGSPATATITIVDNLPVSVTASTPSVPRSGSQSAQFVFTTSKAASFPVTVNYTVGGTATSGAHFKPMTGPVIIPAGSTSATVALTPVDGLYDGNHTVVVTLASGSFYTIGSPATATITIVDNLPVSVTASTPSVPRAGSQSAQFVFTTSKAASFPVTVNYTVGGTATSGTHFKPMTGPVIIPAGSTSATVALTPVDGLYDGNHTVVVTLASGSFYTIGSPATATITIVDNLPVSVTASTPSVPRAGSQSAQFVFTTSKAASFPVTVNYTVGGTATSGTHFKPMTGPVIIPAGSTSATVALTPVDGLYDGNHTVVVTLASGSFYTIGSPATATITIVDSLPVSVTASTPSVPRSGPQSAQFVFTTSKAASFPVTVNYTVGGTATSGAHFKPMTGPVIIPAGSTSATVALTPVDGSYDGNHTVVVTLASGSFYTIGSPMTATITIVDSLPVSVTASTPSVPRSGPQSAQFVFTTSKAASFPVTVNYTVGGTATSGAHFKPMTGPVIIPAGSTSATVALTPVDGSYDGNHTVVVTLASGSFYTIGSPATATITIVDNLPVSVTASTPSVPRSGSQSAQFVFTTSKAASFPVTVNYTVGGTATSGAHFKPMTGPVIIPAGANSATVALTPVDGLYDGNHTAVVTLASGSFYTIGSPATATITIVDNLPVSVTASTPSVPRSGSQSAQFVFTTSKAASFPVTVNYTVGGTATSGAHFKPMTGPVIIPAGSTSATVALTPVDGSYDGNHTVVVTLASGSFYTIGSPATATITIVDSLPVSVTASTPSVPKSGSQSAQFVFTSTRAASFPITVNYTAGGTAKSGANFLPLGSVTIPANATSTTMTLTPVDDHLYDGNQTVVVTLASGSFYTIGSPATATITIVDNDVPAVSVTASSPSIPKIGSQTGQFVFTTSKAASFPVTVNYTVGGTAKDGTNYTLSGSSTIPALATSTTLTLTPKDDGFFDGNQTVIVNLASETSYTIGSPNTATITIVGNDVPVAVVTTASSSVPKIGSETGQFVFFTSKAASIPMTINYTVSGTAKSGTNYTLSGSGTVPAWAISTTLTLTPKDDGFYDGNQTVTVNLASGSLYTVGSLSIATITIVGNDLPAVSVTAPSPSVPKLGTQTGQFIFSITRPAAFPVSVNYIVGGTAKSGGNYILLGSSTIGAYATSTTMTLLPKDDGLYGGDQTVTINLSSGSLYTVGSPDAATITIVGNDLPVVSVIAPSPSIPKLGSQTGQFVFFSSRPASFPLTVAYTLGGTAKSGANYILAGSNTIAALATSASLTVTPKDDGLYDGNQTVIVNLSGSTFYTVGSANTAAITIVDNNLPTLSVAGIPASIPHLGPQTGQFVFSTTKAASFPIIVNYTVGGTAKSGTHYTLSGSNTIAALATSTTITVTPRDDGLYDGNQTVIVSLSGSASYTIGPANTATITITDNNLPTLSIAAIPASIPKLGPQTGQFVFSTSKAASFPITVNYIVGGTAKSGTHYVLSGSGAIPAFATSATLTLTPFDDGLYDGNQTVVITPSSSPLYNVGLPGNAMITIVDNNLPVVSITAMSATVPKLGPQTQFVVSQSRKASITMTINYTTGGSATGDVNYQKLPGSITIPPGSVSASIPLAPIDDGLYDGNQTVVVTLASGPLYALGSPKSAVVTIVDNNLPAVSVTASSPSIPKSGSQSAQFVFTSTRAASFPITVNYTPGGTAKSGANYVPLGPVTIPANATSTALTLTAVDDHLYDGNQTVVVGLASSSFYTIGSPATASITIVDNNVPAVSVTASSPSIPKSGSQSAQFVFSSTRAASFPITVNYTPGGTAKSGANYVPLGPVTIPANATSTTLTLTPVDDHLYDGNQTVVVTLASGSSYTIGSPATATITIADNNVPAVSVTASSPSIPKSGSQSAQFVFTSTRAASFPITVNYAPGGTAKSGANYVPLGPVTIPANATSTALTLTAVDDHLYDGNQTVVVTLASGSFYTIGSPETATITIADNNVPAVSVTASSPSIPKLGSQSAQFVFTSTRAASFPITVNYTPGGTAKSGANYLPLGPVTIPANATSTALTLTAVDDHLYDGNQTVVVTLASGSSYTIGSPATATITIADNNVPAVSITASSPSIPKSGSQSAQFVFTSTRAASFPITVNYTPGGTAKSGANYLPLGLVTIPANATFTTMTLTAVDDHLYDGNQTVVVTLASGSFYTIGSPTTATITIADNNLPAVSVMASSQSIPENSLQPGQFVFTSTRAASFPISVDYTPGGTAKSGTHFQPMTAPVIIPAGSTSATIALQPIDDGLYDGNQTVVVTLSSSSGAPYKVGSPNTATIIILERDLPTVTIKATQPNAVEPSVTGLFTVYRTGTTTLPLTVTYSVDGNATSGVQYVKLLGAVTIPVGASSVDIVVQPLDDSIMEGSTTVIVTILSPGSYNVGVPNSGTVTIADNDAPTVTIAASDNRGIEEGMDPGSFLVSRKGNTKGALTVYYTISTSGWAATNGVDYNYLPGYVVIPDGNASASIQVVPIDDSLPEDRETVILALAANGWYKIGSPSSATVYLANNDLSTATIVASDDNASEAGPKSGKFTVTRNSKQNTPLIVYYTVSGSAQNGTDYERLNGTVSIAAGTASTDFFVAPKDDTVYGGDRTVIVTLSGSVYYLLGKPNKGTVIIHDNDLPTVSITAPVKIIEENGTTVGLFTVSRKSGESNAWPLSVNYDSSGGTAINGIDYNGVLSGTVTIPAGDDNTSIQITPIDDKIMKGTRTVTATLTSSTAYKIASPVTATISIMDDEWPKVAVGATSDLVSEAGTNPGKFTIYRTGDMSSPLTVNYTMGGSAFSGTDYVALPGKVTIPANTSAMDIELTPIDDKTVAPDKTVVLTISDSSSYYTDSTTNHATLIIVDAEQPKVSIYMVQNASESGMVGRFRVQRFGNCHHDLTVNYTSSSTGQKDVNYVALPDYVTIPAGQAFAFIDVTAIDDNQSLGDVTLNVALSPDPLPNLSYALGTPTSAWLLIIDTDPPVVVIKASESSIIETGVTTGKFTATRTGSTVSALVVQYDLGGTAKSGVDFKSPPFPLLIPAGKASAAINVTPIDDKEYKGDRTVVATLLSSSSSAYYLGAPDNATITIRDNELPTVSITVADAVANRPGNTGRFKINRTGITSAPLKVKYSTDGTATNGTDYKKLAGAVTIPKGSSSVSILITPAGPKAKVNKTVILKPKSSTVYSLVAPKSGTVTILADNLPKVSVVASDPTATEPGLKEGKFTVSRTRDTTSALTVQYTLGGTAKNGTDHVTLPGTVMIPAGALSADIAVTPVVDAIVDDNQTVVLRLAETTAYISAAPSSATVTIKDNSPPKVTIKAKDTSISEDVATPGQFTVTRTRTGAPTSDLLVNYEVGGTAKANVDYKALSKSLVIPAESSSANIDVTPIDDNVSRGDRTVIVSLSSSTDYDLSSPDNATMTILENDLPTVSISVTDNTAALPSNNGTFKIKRAGITTNSLAVKYTIDGTAKNGVNYKKLTGTVTIPAGSLSVNIQITPLDDGQPPADKSVILTLAPSSAYTIGLPASGTVTILGDDVPSVPIVTLDPKVWEESPREGKVAAKRTGAMGLLPSKTNFKAS